MLFDAHTVYAVDLFRNTLLEDVHGRMRQQTVPMLQSIGSSN
jgi:hypothetical protein